MPRWNKQRHSWQSGGKPCPSTKRGWGWTPTRLSQLRQGGGCNCRPRTSPHRPSTPTTRPCSPGAWTTSSSDHDAVWAQVAAPTQHQRRRNAQWGPEVVSQRPPARSGDPHADLADVAAVITKPGGGYKQLQAQRRAAQRMGQEGGAARTAWKAISRARKQEQRAWQQANVLRASQMDWRAKRTLDHHSSRQGWEHRLLDDSHWQGQAPAAFRGHFPSDPAKQHSGTSPGHTCTPQQSLQATPMATIHGGRAETGYRYLAPGQSHGAGRDFPGGPSRCKQDQTSCQASRGGNATDTVTVISHSRRHRGGNNQPKP